MLLARCLLPEVTLVNALLIEAGRLELAEEGSKHDGTGELDRLGTADEIEGAKTVLVGESGTMVLIVKLLVGWSWPTSMSALCERPFRVQLAAVKASLRLAAERPLCRRLSL